MNKARVSLLVLVVVCCLVPQTALAWGPRGHRVIGMIAEQRLAATSPQVLERALTFLRTTNADRTNCEATEPARSFADVSNMADEFRQNELALVTRDWHFVNINIANPTYDERRDCPTGDCIVSRIERMRAILADPNRQNCDKESALIYLIHFIGDLHQPFHAGFGILPNGDSDLGANRVTVVIDAQERRLHGVWDSSLIERQNLTEEQWVTRLMTTVLAGRDPAKLAGRTLIDWTNESHVLAGKFHVKNEKPPVALDSKYLDASTATVDERLLLAGLRLARVIEEALTERAPAAAPAVAASTSETATAGAASSTSPSRRRLRKR